ncbi:hypothetical protein WKW79_17410 [Variovorax robiniae]|uniref:Uncharacterized protein n=1 Tax=Variovorax robiniae TaxID=1836199 RepID=A0ABU8X972_9BURK
MAAAITKKRLYRPMRQDEYVEVLKTHGRRVANRVALAHLPKSHRTLQDFYLCYAPETGLSENEMCWTGLINKFDPTGWFSQYAPGKPRELHPAPEGMAESEGASVGAMSVIPKAEPEPIAEPNDTEASRALDAEIDALFDKFINASTASDLSADILAASTRLLGTKLFAADTTQQDIAGWIADGIKGHA